MEHPFSLIHQNAQSACDIISEMGILTLSFISGWVYKGLW